MKVIAIVVTYRRLELLNRVITRLIEQSLEISRVLVIDNNSGDGTKELVESISQQNSLIEYYNTGGNLGGAGGFHYGFSIVKNTATSYDYLWLMNDDFLPAKDCLEKLVMDRPQGIVQPIRYNLDGSCAEISPVFYDLNKIFCVNPKQSTVLDVFHEDIDGKYIDIAGVPFEGPLISRSVVDRIGAPNPDFFIFNDDLDFSIRAKRAGFPIQCSLAAKAERLLVNNQLSDLKSWKGYFMLRNHFYIIKSYGGNAFVRNRYFFIAFFFMLRAISSLNFGFLKIVYCALRDSSSLKNNEKFKP